VRYTARASVLLVYNLLLAVGSVLLLPYFLWKGLRTGKHLSTFSERWNGPPPALNAGAQASIWIHAVSVGEALAARTLLEPLRQALPELRLFVSTTTVTGNAVARNSIPGVDGFFFAPFDRKGSVRAALDRVHPRLLVIMETEIWPNLIHEAHRRGVKVAIVNGRISPRSYPRYLWIRSFLRPLLQEIDLFLMQGEPHLQRILQIGAPPERATVPGNLKYDAIRDAHASEAADIVASRPERALWIAGSTAPGEEPLVFRALLQVRAGAGDVGLVIAPRHPERFDEVEALAKSAGLRCARRSRLSAGGWRDEEVLLLDSIGELASVYALGRVVFVGGSLAPFGGHNILEAAAAGRAVVVGPHMENFQEIADEFEAAGALVRVRSAEELADATLSLLADDARREALGARGREILSRNRGAAARSAAALAALVA
jgi:3-deoxy-D-manno-octulosonic-acid transferase